jgi:SpoVK/Ycf46/Vps4 family AAA+-type ATPase
MANVVAKLLLSMRLVQSSNVVFVNNSLELLGSYVGQTPIKVDAKVAEAAGGVLFIDEAYSIVKEGGGREGSGASFGKEAIDTLMKHMDPPSCVMIFAGYTSQMEDFLNVNPGLARRIPYRYHFHAYTPEQLQHIFIVMCQAKGETLTEHVKEQVNKPPPPTTTTTTTRSLSHSPSCTDHPSLPSWPPSPAAAHLLLLCVCVLVV